MGRSLAAAAVASLVCGSASAFRPPLGRPPVSTCAAAASTTGTAAHVVHDESALETTLKADGASLSDGVRFGLMVSDTRSRPPRPPPKAPAAAPPPAPPAPPPPPLPLHLSPTQPGQLAL